MSNTVILKASLKETNSKQIPELKYQTMSKNIEIYLNLDKNNDKKIKIVVNWSGT